MSCAVCDHAGFPGSRTLSAGAIIRLADAPVLSGLRLISISGGEPTLHPQFAAILKNMFSLFGKARVVILTNLLDPAALYAALGPLTAKELERLHIGTSIDGPEHEHDALRGHGGALKRTVSAVKRLKQLYPRLSIGATLTVSRTNAAKIYAAYELCAAELGIPLGIQPVIPNPSNRAHMPDRARLACAAEQIGLILSDINRNPESRTLYSFSETAALSRLARFFSNGSGRSSVRCGAGEAFVMISPEGAVYLCPGAKNVVLGDVGTSDLGTIWRAASSRASTVSGHMPACARCFLRCADQSAIIHGTAL